MNYPPKRPDTRNEELVEESFQDIGKAARGVWDFFTSGDNKEFLRKVDARHGTNLGELHARIQAGPQAEEPEEKDPDTIDMKPIDADGEVVIVIQETCAFCEGKQVIALKGKTRTPIACPTCKQNPHAKTPKRLAR